MECIPTLFPTAEEFSNPIEYLSEPKIKRLGHTYGMIKLIPPKDFKPPFSINKKDFRFNVRIQKLSELSITNRSRLFFMKQLNNFNRIKEGKHYNTKKLTLPYIYCGETSKIYLYDLFIQIVKDTSESNSEKDSKIENSRRGKRARENIKESVTAFSLPDIDIILDDSGLWKRMSRIFHTPSVQLQNVFNKYVSSYYKFVFKQVKTGGFRVFSRLLYRDKYPKSLLSDGEDSASEESDDDEGCVICDRSNKPTKMILCDSCDKPFHISCLSPPLPSVPKGDWICNNCIIGNGYYGFKEETHLYTLAEFQEYCNHRETDLTTDKLSGGLLPIEKLEEKFWNYVDNMEDTMTVKYGADINGSQPGEITGFPTSDYIPEDLSDEQKSMYSAYLDHPMNLTNLPKARGSLLPMFDRKISGMTVPWIYIGSTFSTFCWHLEDQYTLSANYQHTGAPKIWYSIPEYSCDKFHTLLRNVAPDLFDKQPDLMHQLVTLISPYDKRFKEAKIICYKAIQMPNEYIVTFPKCYHAGFNSGFNFNEAVNFTLDSWVPYGVQAISDYRNTGKQCVFDMFELMLKILECYLQGSANFQESLIRTCYSELLNAFNSKTRMIQQLSDIIANESYSFKVMNRNNQASNEGGLPSPKKEIDYFKPHEYDWSHVYGNQEDGDNEEEDYDVYCAKCGTICFLAFIAHYNTNLNHKRRRLHSYSPKRINKLSGSKELEILCLKDYLQLVEDVFEHQADDKDDKFSSRNDPFINDELVYLRDTQDVEEILRKASKKIDRIRN